MNLAHKQQHQEDKEAKSLSIAFSYNKILYTYIG